MSISHSTTKYRHDRRQLIRNRQMADIMFDRDGNSIEIGFAWCGPDNTQRPESPGDGKTSRLYRQGVA